MAGSKIKLDLTGKRYDYFRVVDRDAAKSGYWICLCDCGAKFSARSSDIRAYKTTSCGCQKNRGGSLSRMNRERRGGYNI